MNEAEEKDINLQFQRINLFKIRKQMNKLPLKPCIRCKTFVNYETHNRSQCALFQHEKEKEKETTSESESNKEENEKQKEDSNNWRKEDPSGTWKNHGRASFHTNDKRKMRQNVRRTIENIYEQQINHSEKKPIFTKPNYNVFKWNITEQPKQIFEWPSTSKNSTKHHLSNITELLNRKSRRTICIEGNIAAGKSTILNIIKELGNTNISTLQEPLKKWKDVHDINLLQLMYQEPAKWTTAFQSFALLSMAQNHMSPGKIKFIERCIYSSKYVFMEANKANGNIDNINWSILNNWFNFVTTNMKINMDAIIYIKTSPHIAYQRMKKRNRPEESEVSEEHIRNIHQLYENWLVKGNFSWPCQIIVLNGDKTTEEIMKDLNEEVTLIA